MSTECGGRMRLSFRLGALLALLCAAAGWFYGLEIAPRGLLSIGRWILPCSDLAPVWYGARAALLEHASPYAPELAARAQLAIYGQLAPGGADQQSFAYPLFSVFVFAPFALAPLAMARVIAFVVFAALTLFSILCWTERPTRRFLAIAAPLALASFPCFYALILLQPTALFAALLAAGCAAARRGWLLCSGVLLALSCCKPQLVAGVLLALLLWALSDLRRRWMLPASLAATLGGLLLLSQLLQPGWIPVWLRILHEYSAYTQISSMLFLAGYWPGVALTALLVAAVLCIAWRRREELGYTVALCAGATALAAPLHVYDEILLLGPILWIYSHRRELSGWTGGRLCALLDLTLGIGWLYQILVALLYLYSRPAAVALWGLPFGLTAVLPYAAILPLLYYAVRAPGRGASSPDPAREP